MIHSENHCTECEKHYCRQRRYCLNVLNWQNYVQGRIQNLEEGGSGFFGTIAPLPQDYFCQVRALRRTSSIFKKNDPIKKT